jgi:drug/metabolite transporter (DMT)-like permease
LRAFSSHKEYLFSLLIAITGAVLFAAKAIIVKLLYRYHLDALMVITFRMMFSLPFFLSIAVWQTYVSAPLTKSEYGRIVLLGFVGYYAATFLDFLGLQYISAGLERLIIFLAPSFVLLMSAVFLKKKISSLQWLALVVSYAGTLLVFMHDANAGGSNIILGCIYVLASALSYALYLLLSGELVQRAGSLRLASYAMLVSTVACIIHFLLRDPVSLLLHQPAPVYYLSLVNAVFCTVLPVFLTMIAVGRLGAGLAAQAGMVGPVSTLFMAAALLGEPITIIQIIGTVFVLAGVYFLSQKRNAASVP